MGTIMLMNLDKEVAGSVVLAESQGAAAGRRQVSSSSRSKNRDECESRHMGLWDGNRRFIAENYNCFAFGHKYPHVSWRNHRLLLVI